MHRASPRFWRCYEALPDELKRLADKNFDLPKQDARHPSLQLKKVRRFWSVRVGLHHRSLAVEQAGDLVWFWIGTHAEYDKLVENA